MMVMEEEKYIVKILAAEVDSLGELNFPLKLF